MYDINKWCVEKEEINFSEEYLCCQLCIQGKLDICGTEEPQTINILLEYFARIDLKWINLMFY